jgi:peptide/nickel transport system ATP-binding protein
MSEPVLSLDNLTVDIRTEDGILHAVRGLSLEVRASETVCLVGESGCGKSMTSLAIMGLLPRSATAKADRFRLAGRDLAAGRPADIAALRGVTAGMIFQEPMTALNPSYTIGDQLTEVHRHHLKSSPAEAEARALELLGLVGIANAKQRLGQYPHQLSGGLRQRIMIAMALMCAPQLLIADEPTTALDVTIQAQILKLLIDIQKELGLGLLLITHDLGVVARIATRVNVMYAGRIVESGTAADVFRQPRHPYTRGLMGCLPVPGKTLPGARLGVIPGSVPSLIGEVRGCAFAARCPQAEARCSTPVPIWREGSQAWECHVERGAAGVAA